MRDFYFFTSQKITAKDCFDALSKEIINTSVSKKTEEIQISMGDKHRSYLWFYNERLSDGIYESDEDFEKEKKLIPITDPFINHFETYRSVDAKRVIKILVGIFPELYINVADDEWYGSAQEYLDTEFDY